MSTKFGTFDARLGDHFGEVTEKQLQRPEEFQAAANKVANPKHLTEVDAGSEKLDRNDQLKAAVCKPLPFCLSKTNPYYN